MEFTINKIFVLSIRWLLIYNLGIQNSVANIDDNEKTHSRNSRALLFPASSTAGIFVALAIPIDLAHRNVFLSYNFEANYNLPYEGWHYIHGPLQRLKYEYESEAAAAYYSDAEEGRNSKNGKNSTLPVSHVKHKKIIKKPKAKPNSANEKEKLSSVKIKRQAIDSLISRANIYEIINGKLKHAGYKGKTCLLRTICEVNALDFGSINGVFGEILHIIFKPTSSADEQLAEEYYVAEMNGLLDKCNIYYERCPKSVLELISKEYNTYL